MDRISHRSTFAVHLPDKATKTMATRTRILVVDKDLNTLSRIYLALIHRNYKAEASDNLQEITQRIKRLKPSLIILGVDEYNSVKDSLRIPVILLKDGKAVMPVDLPSDVITVEKSIQVEKLIAAIEELVY